MSAVVSILLGLYGLVASVFLISESRRPQATLAWLLVFFFAPGIGLVIYILFGRDRKAFSKRSKLLMQDLEPSADPLLGPLLSRKDNEIEILESRGAIYRKLMRLVRRNSQSVLTTRNRVVIQQNAATFYRALSPI